MSLLILIIVTVFNLGSVAFMLYFYIKQKNWYKIGKLSKEKLVTKEELLETWGMIIVFHIEFTFLWFMFSLAYL